MIQRIFVLGPQKNGSLCKVKKNVGVPNVQARDTKKLA
jgi:hypothetical protein